MLFADSAIRSRSSSEIWSAGCFVYFAYLQDYVEISKESVCKCLFVATVGGAAKPTIELRRCPMMQQDALATLANISRSTVNIQSSQSRTESRVFSFMNNSSGFLTICCCNSLKCIFSYVLSSASDLHTHTHTHPPALHSPGLWRCPASSARPEAGGQPSPCA